MEWKKRELGGEDGRVWRITKDRVNKVANRERRRDRDLNLCYKRRKKKDHIKFLLFKRSETSSYKHPWCPISKLLSWGADVDHRLSLYLPVITRVPKQTSSRQQDRTGQDLNREIPYSLFALVRKRSQTLRDTGTKTSNLSRQMRTGERRVREF